MDCKEAPSEEVLFKPRSPGRKESRPRKGRRKGGPAGENWWCKCPEAGTSWACGRTKKAEIAWESRTWSQGYQPWLEEVTGVEKTRELRKAEPGAGRAESPPGSWGFAGVSRRQLGARLQLRKEVSTCILGQGLKVVWVNGEDTGLRSSREHV